MAADTGPARVPRRAVLLATTNPGKLREIRDVLDGLPLDLVTPGDLGISEPDEHGTTFAENAREKARYYARASGLLAAADDSGLVIDALDGAPGVHSARFPGATYEEKFVNLFKLMDARGAGTSRARFVCAVALASPAGSVAFEAEGTVEGFITREPRGTGGFGYDPIFYYPPLDRTLAEVTAAEKSAVSHRGQAFRALRSFLAGRIDGASHDH